MRDTRDTSATGAPQLPVTLTPQRSLLVYYSLASLLMGPAFLIGWLIGYFRFRTLRYELDEEGISMRWGVLFRREISLTYARIQDIQLTSNVLERWLGLARIQLQTASGSADAEMTLEGLRDTDGLRNFLYARMRGVRDARDGAQATVPGYASSPGHASSPDHASSPGHAGAAALTRSQPALPGLAAVQSVPVVAVQGSSADAELAQVLNRIADELHALRTSRDV